MKFKKIKILGFSLLVMSCGLEDQINELQNSDALSESSEFTSLLNDYGVTDDGATIADEESSLTDLSEDAAAMLEQIVAIRELVKGELDLICAPDQELIDTVQAELQAIYDDTSLTEAEQREAARAVKDQYIDALQADRAAMKQCIADNQEAWDAVKATFDPIETACLLEKGMWNRGHRHGRGGHGQGRPVDSDSDTETQTDDTTTNLTHNQGEVISAELLAEFEAKLTSEDCSAAIASYPSTDSTEDESVDTTETDE